MTNYAQIERDFIERTLQIIDQYEEMVRPNLPPENQYEVTLLMNCLLGLLVYPQQVANKKEFQKFFNRWLTEALVIDVGHEWGLDKTFIMNAGFDNDHNKISAENLTLRNLVRQMRNKVAHAGFHVNDNDPKRQIDYIEFKSDEKDGLHLVLPIRNLEIFVRKLATSALEHIPNESER